MEKTCALSTLLREKFVQKRVLKVINPLLEVYV